MSVLKALRTRSSVGEEYNGKEREWKKSEGQGVILKRKIMENLMKFHKILLEINFFLIFYK